jgi:hypothetical protein
VRPIIDDRRRTEDTRSPRVDRNVDVLMSVAVKDVEIRIARQEIDDALSSAEPVQAIPRLRGMRDRRMMKDDHHRAPAAREIAYASLERIGGVPGQLTGRARGKLVIPLCAAA